jgi:hypothetical protein
VQQKNRGAMILQKVLDAALGNELQVAHDQVGRVIAPCGDTRILAPSKRSHFEGSSPRISARRLGANPERGDELNQPQTWAFAFGRLDERWHYG